MKNKDCYICRFKNPKKGIMCLQKKPVKSNFTLNSIIIKDYPRLNTCIINNEINIKDILNNMLIRTNKIYESLQFNTLNLKLDNEEFSKRAKIIRNIKDFIVLNVVFKNNSNVTEDNIICDTIYFFDLLTIQNKKFHLLSTLEKLGLGALILVIKFNKLHEKIFVKKYKSIFDNKYMTLEEINKIEISSLKLMNYYITQPNPINYLYFLYENIFINNKCKTMKFIYKLMILILKNIMFFSNNYLKYHPFYLSCFIIKYCFEQNKIDGFQKSFIDFFDINMRLYRTLYEEFLKTNNNQIKNINRKILYQNNNENNSNTEKKMKSIEIVKEEKMNDMNNYTSFKYFRKINNLENYNNSSYINNFNYTNKNNIYGLNNSYYKKFLNNYLEIQSSEHSKCESKIKYLRTKEIRDLSQDIFNKKEYHSNKVNKFHYNLESPKKTGISMNYRLKKKPPSFQINKANEKCVSFNLKEIKENEKQRKFNDNKENYDMNKKNDKIKVTVIAYKPTRYDLKSRINSSQERCSSIRKSYLNKNNNSNNFNENKITSKLINFNNSISVCRKLKENNNSEILPNHDNKKIKSIHTYEGSIIKGSTNQNEPSFNYNNNKKEKEKRKICIRNFYKSKNTFFNDLNDSAYHRLLLKKN